MNTFFKKILPVILIIAIFSVSLPIVNAQVFPPPGAATKGSDTACSWQSPTSWFTSCLLVGVNYILELVLKIFVWGITFAGAILNMIIKVQNGAFYDQPMVNIGWKIARDVVNIFYVLFLLIIAIATILGISSYGMKQLLWKLILSALLVNFSLPLGGIIIDASNALGNSFYLQMGTPVAGSPDRDLAKTFVKGFQTQKAYQSNPDQTGPSNGSTSTLINIAIAYIIGIILVCITVFTMLAACFLLVARIVILWIVLILSPFAFLFMVLPRTSSISNKWFETLFNQSFFYPAYMFMLYIVFKAIDGGVITKFFKDADTDPTIANALRDTGFGSQTTLSASPYLILSGVTLGVFLIAALVVAKSMGAYGASAAMAYGQKAAQSAKSYAGAGAKRTYEKVAGSSAAAATLGHVPLVRRAVATAMQHNAEAQAYRGKTDAAKMKNLDPKSQARIFSTLSAKGQAEALKSMDDKRKGQVAQHLNGANATQIGNALVRHGGELGIDETSARQNAAAFIAQSQGGTHAAMQMLHNEYKGEVAPHTDTPEGDVYARKLDEFMKNMTPDQRKSIYNNQSDKQENEQAHVQDYFLNNEKNLNAFTQNREGINTGNEFLSKIYTRLGARNAPEMTDLIKNRYKNKGLSDVISADIGVNMVMAPHTVTVHEKSDDKLSEIAKAIAAASGGP